MAAVVTKLGTQTFNTTSGTHTVVGTPASGDLIVLVVANTGYAGTTLPTDNNADGNGTYTLVKSAAKATSADTVQFYIRNSLIGSNTSTTFTHAPGTTSGGGLVVLKVTGMTTVGAAAARQSASQDNQSSGGTPTPVFSSAALTFNPVIGAVFNATNAATITPRSSPSYTEIVDVGYATPATGLEVMSINSGETASSIAWGGTSASAFCSIAVELAFNTTPTIALNTPADAASISDTTPTLDFTGTDADADSIEYEAQIDTVNTFDSHPGSPAVCDSYSESNQSDSKVLYAGSSYQGIGQSFTGNGNVLDSAKFYLAKNNTTPSANAVAKIYAHSGTFGSSSVPTGAALATSDNFNTAAVSSFSYAIFTLSFSGANRITLTNGTNYIVAFEYAGGDATHGVAVGIDPITHTHGGNNSEYNGSAWTARATTDTVFYVYTAGANTPLLDRLSVSDSGFVNPDTGGDTHPFNSGENIQFTVQGGDALSDGTYYWRVRAKDPSGTNTFGSWSSTRSFIVSTASAIVNKVVQIGQAIKRASYY